ncbi:BON domain-containing protein [Streptomyces tendae]
MDDIGRPVGVVTQADLVRKVARRPEPTDRSAGENVTVEELDDALREEISRDVLIRTPGLAPTDMTVHVNEGEVTVEDRVENQQLVPVIEWLRLGVDGVVPIDLLRPRRPHATSNPSAELAPSKLQPGMP